MTEWRDHLEILGPDLSVWPPRLAEAGIALMSASDEARDIFALASGAAVDAGARASGEKRTVIR